MFRSVISVKGSQNSASSSSRCEGTVRHRTPSESTDTTITLWGWWWLYVTITGKPTFVASFKRTRLRSTILK